MTNAEFDVDSGLSKAEEHSRSLLPLLEVVHIWIENAVDPFSTRCAPNVRRSVSPSCLAGLVMTESGYSYARSLKSPFCPPRGASDIQWGLPDYRPPPSLAESSNAVREPRLVHEPDLADALKDFQERERNLFNRGKPHPHVQLLERRLEDYGDSDKDAEAKTTSQDCDSEPRAMEQENSRMETSDDETFMEFLEAEFLDVAYLEGVLNDHNIGETDFFLYFNEAEDVFEFHFDDYRTMGRIVGIGVEYSKVVFEEESHVKVKEISKQEWEDGLRICRSSPNTLKFKIPEFQGDSPSLKDFLEHPAHAIGKGSLLQDAMKYYMLKAAKDSILSNESTITNINNLGRASSSSNKWYKVLKDFQWNVANFLKSYLDEFWAFLKAPREKKKTKVYLDLLPGGYVSTSEALDDDTRKLALKLDNTISSSMEFTFIKEDDWKKIQVIVGPVIFQLQCSDQEENYQSGWFGWFHKFLNVSFGVDHPLDAKLRKWETLHYKEEKVAHDARFEDIKLKHCKNDGGIKIEVSVPPVLKMTASGSRTRSTDTTTSNATRTRWEETIQYTQGGFEIYSNPDMVKSILRYMYILSHDYQAILDREKLLDEDYRTMMYSTPICRDQVVGFEGTWSAYNFGEDPYELVKYTFEASRRVQMNFQNSTHQVLKKKKSWGIHQHGKQATEAEKNDVVKITQKCTKDVYINHAMTHLNLSGPRYNFFVKEWQNQMPLRQFDSETYLGQQDNQNNPPLWNNNQPLLDLIP